MNRITLSLAMVTLAMSFNGHVSAQCGPSAKLNFSARVNPASRLRTASPVARASTPNDTTASIVGLWDAIFSVDGQLVDEGFDLWHSDGTETLNDIPAPATGNVCLGVWVQTGGTYNLAHPFWIFDSSNVNLIGRGLIQEQVAVDAGGNSYSGKFTIQYHDLMGNPMPEFPDAAGDVSATRITATAVNDAPMIKVTTASGTTANANGLLQTPFTPLLLDASGSTGVGALTYSWSSTPPARLTPTQTPGQILVDLAAAGDYVINLKVTDSQGNTATFSATVEFTGRL